MPSAAAEDEVPHTFVDAFAVGSARDIDTWAAAPAGCLQGGCIWASNEEYGVGQLAQLTYRRLILHSAQAVPQSPDCPPLGKESCISLGLASASARSMPVGVPSK